MSSNKEYTGLMPAFPCPNDAKTGEMGMTLRDYFAAKFMQGELSRSLADGEELLGFDRIATLAYEMADSMMEARIKRGEYDS